MATEHGSEPAKNSPAPQWRDALAAIGVAVSIVMGVVAYFVPKAEAPKPGPVAASAGGAVAAGPSVSATVSGSGNVVAGSINGAQIVIGAPVPASVSASGGH
jgi:hypothetical protein